MVIQIFNSYRAATVPLVFTVFLCCAMPLMADDSTSGSGWEYAAEIYLWAPQITATTPRGDPDLPFYQILDDLQFTFMGAFAARKDKWTFVNDLIYLDVKQDVNRQRDILGGIGELDVTILAYRYLDYNFDEDNKVMEELDVKGPFLGFMFKF